MTRIDMNPQWLNDYVTMSAANTYTSKTINLPINPAATTTKGKTRVLEVLKVFWFLSPDALAEDGYVAGQLSYAVQAAILAETDVGKFISQCWIDQQLITSGGVQTVLPHMQDFTDGQGNGILLASPQIFLGVNSVGMTAARTCGIKILYRYKDIPIEEFIGIVNGQQ